MQIPEVKTNIYTYKKNILESSNYLSDYDRGLYNGLEIVLAMVEKRPSFLINKDNEFNKSDIAEFPEFFL